MDEGSIPIKDEPYRVFLDSNVVIQEGRALSSPALIHLENLATAGIVRVLTTDITCNEIAKRHADNDHKLVKSFSRAAVRERLSLVVGISLPEATDQGMKAKLFDFHLEAVSDFYERLGTETLSVDEIKPSVVFAAYAGERGFFSGKGKSKQFADAFVVERLRVEATVKRPIIVVSGDGDFELPIGEDNTLSLVRSLPELFAQLGLESGAPDVTQFLRAHHNDLVDATDRELAQWGLVGDVEDSDIEETDVMDVELREIMAFRAATSGESILVVGSAKVEAKAAYVHPDWDSAIYDSEDRIVIPLHTVRGEADVSFDVDVAMSVSLGDDGLPSRIEGLQFRDDRFQFVELYPMGRYD